MKNILNLGVPDDEAAEIKISNVDIETLNVESDVGNFPNCRGSDIP